MVEELEALGDSDDGFETPSLLRIIVAAGQ
jgi:hypothetical protein